jgi:two-component system chemotaxis response regulator CheB
VFSGSHKKRGIIEILMLRKQKLPENGICRFGKIEPGCIQSTVDERKQALMKFSRDIVAIGVLGQDNLESVKDLISSLPVDFSASVLIVLQVPAEVSKIEEILVKKASLPFVWAREGQNIRSGYVYLGSAFSSLVTRPWGVLGLEPAMANDHHHLAIARFFDSAAYVWGNRVIGVLLNSENAFQAAATLASVKATGGIAVIREQASIFSSSFCDGIDKDESHRLLPTTNIANLLVRLVEMPPSKIPTDLSFKMRNQRIYDC